MMFAEWKTTSKVFGMFRERAENYGIGLQECCQAAYKAGERQGRKDVEDLAKRAAVLRDAARPCGDTHEPGETINARNAASKIARGIEGLDAPAPRWWHCDTHGPGSRNAWGCPECVREMREEVRKMHACAAALSNAIPRWVPVAERMPDSVQTVLACYRNSHGNWRRIRAEWIADKTQESGSESDIGQYDEATDTHYNPEGWYEKIDNWDDYTAVAVHQGEVTHWMLMPPAPALPGLGPNEPGAGG